VLLRETLNRIGDGLPRTEIHLLGQRWAAFRLCGYTGLTLAVLLGCGLAMARGLSIWVLGALVASAVLTFLALAMATKIVVGEERLVYYHHEIAIVASGALVLALLGQPVLPYLDITILGIGAFLACGRVGCLLVGCCHGRPHAWGVRYRHEHVDEGFASYLVGVRLFPTQAIEALWVASVVLVGSALVLRGGQPGAALAWYVVTYDLARFLLEFMRGDAARPYILGFSEAQWISLGLLLVAVGAELYGILPFQAWHLGVAVGMVLTMLAVVLRRRYSGMSRYLLLHPRHVRELAEALDRAREQVPNIPTRDAGVYVATTSLGLSISAGRQRDLPAAPWHYTISRRGQPLGYADARSIALQVERLRHPDASVEVIAGGQGLFHLLVRQRETDVLWLSPARQALVEERGGRYHV
jgi:prolipoprotein diacylglyceryltransferase